MLEDNPHSCTVFTISFTSHHFLEMPRLVLCCAWPRPNPMYLLVLFFILCISSRALSAASSSPTGFIKASCKATSYPSLCVQCLSGYARAIQRSEKHLAVTALSVSVGRARSAVAFVTKLTKVRGIKRREYLAVKDCIETMGDSIDQLSQSVKELRHMGQHLAVGHEFVWHMSNVQTWVSAALTNENTCLDGFSGRLMDGNVKAALKHRVTDVARVTSNALALVNRFASRHQKVAATNEKP